MKLKDTLCLPRTDFPMRAELPKREPERLARWEREDLYGRMRAAHAAGPKYVLHDGPPYANGHVHLGTALNKILKDFVVRARAQAGHDTPYVPGWDCHGMPIEHQVLKDAKAGGRELSPAEVRQRCRDFADRFLDVQRQEFRRLGILGSWSDPYLTKDPNYEAAIVRAFGALHEKGYIYRGLRSIHWCPTCRTALANAEVEYDTGHESVTIHVRFALERGQGGRLRGLPDDAVALVWTTTPWTIPANVAIAVHPDLEYVLVGGDARNALVARPLLPSVAAELGWSDVPVLASWKGHELEGLTFRHPLFDRPSPVVPADYVTTDAGTGLVHTAPGHGAEDFETGRKHGLPILVPVDRGGVFTQEAGPYAGRHVFKANADIVRDLAAAGALEHEGRLVHSYPTCWRCHGALIFLATEQWFWNVDHERLRARCLEEVDRASWVPSWGHDRMHDSVSARPDWCLSRQRAWGVPIPALACTACGQAVANHAVFARAEEVVREGGAEAWFERSATDLAPEGLRCPGCGGASFEKDPNILDVWFDASCSHLAVLASGRWPELSWPADLYLEAVDQHRGWFQVSLLNAVALRGAAPYRQVLTHGLILDEQGRKMSKSLGNVVSPDEILAQQGADVLRLFFASVDCTADIRFSRGLITPVSESYRKIRNTLRFLVANLGDFDRDRDAVAPIELLEVDRHALGRLHAVSADVRKAYDELAFHRALRLLLGYLTSDVSAFFAHVLKDRLYAEASDGPRRRSAQTALHEIARECCQLLAPILCFTAEEVWEHLPPWKGKPASVHEATWLPIPSSDPALATAWEAILAVRDEAMKALEAARNGGLIGDPLEAALRLSPPKATAEAIVPRVGLLAEAFVVSEVTLAAADEAAPPGAHVAERLEGCWIAVTRSTGVKCPRCWTRRHDAGRWLSHPDVCARCADVIVGLGVEVDATP